MQITKTGKKIFQIATTETEKPYLENSITIHLKSQKPASAMNDVTKITELYFSLFLSLLQDDQNRRDVLNSYDCPLSTTNDKMTIFLFFLFAVVSVTNRWLRYADMVINNCRRVMRCGYGLCAFLY